MDTATQIIVSGLTLGANKVHTYTIIDNDNPPFDFVGNNEDNARPVDLLTLPRLTVNAGTGVAGLARLLGRGPTPAGRRAASVKRVAWRAVRQLVPPVGRDPREGRPVA